jgi:hypothetical protein
VGLFIAGGFIALLVAGAIIQWRRRGKYDFYPQPTGDDLPAHFPDPGTWEGPNEGRMGPL